MPLELHYAGARDLCYPVRTPAHGGGFVPAPRLSDARGPPSCFADKSHPDDEPQGGNDERVGDPASKLRVVAYETCRRVCDAIGPIGDTSCILGVEEFFEGENDLLEIVFHGGHVVDDGLFDAVGGGRQARSR